MIKMGLDRAILASTPHIAYTQIIPSILFPNRVDTTVYTNGCVKPRANRPQHVKPIVYKNNELHRLLACCDENSDDEDNAIVIRFAVDKTGNLFFAKEGKPSRSIPGHREMVSECLAAGNLAFKDNKLVLISNQSGDFKPGFQSLQFVIVTLLNNNIEFSATIRLDEYVPNIAERTPINKHLVNAAELLQHIKNLNITFPEPPTQDHKRKERDVAPATISPQRKKHQVLSSLGANTINQHYYSSSTSRLHRFLMDEANESEQENTRSQPTTPLKAEQAKSKPPSPSTARESTVSLGIYAPFPASNDTETEWNQNHDKPHVVCKKLFNH